MRRVEEAVIRPMACAVFPQLGARHPRGYFDTGSELASHDSHVYVSVEAAETMARELGWSPPEELAHVERELALARARVTELEDQLTEASRFAEAIDVIESADFRARKKPGRPKKEESVAA